MSKQTFEDIPALKWFGAALDADLNYKRQNMHSDNTCGKGIPRNWHFHGIN